MEQYILHDSLIQIRCLSRDTGTGGLSTLHYLPSVAGQLGCHIWPAMLTQSDFLQPDPNSRGICISLRWLLLQLYFTLWRNLVKINIINDVEILHIWSDLKIWNTVKPLWKGQECLTKVAKFCPFPCTILYKSCLFYPSWQATSFERPPSWVAFIEGFHCIPISVGLASIMSTQLTNVY